MPVHDDNAIPEPANCADAPLKHVQRMLEQKARDAVRKASEQQHKAADPRASVFVNANAGSGKTYLLVNRVIRLLLNGARPENILCLTYTRAAAAEMRSRLFDRLAEWIHLDDADLKKVIRDKLNHHNFTDEQLPLARRLFARALETPGGLRVQTIHAFCERLLQAFPVEAGMPPGFEVMDEAETHALLDEARLHLLSGKAAKQAAGETVRDDLALLAVHFHEAELLRMMEDILAHRQLLARMNASDNFRQTVFTELRRVLGIDKGAPEDEEALLKAWRVGLDATRIENWVQRLKPLAQQARNPREPDKKRANDHTLDCLKALLQTLREDDAQALWPTAGNWFLTRAGEARKTILTSEVKKADPSLAAELELFQQEILQLHQILLAHQALRLNMALVRTGMAILQLYEQGKARLGKFDYDDLVLRTLELLEGVDAQWVLYRLDGGIEHILLDEAQDTTPEQWEILQKLTEEFTAGMGAERGNAMPRTVFAVGDVKQSIYSFQGAAPEAFHFMRDFFEQRHEEAGLKFEKVPLGTSFRTVQPILDIVDKVLELPGFDLGEEQLEKHASARPHVPGFVELWPLETDDDDNAADGTDTNNVDADDPVTRALRQLWTPPASLQANTHPRLKLAARIADTIRRWLDNGEALPPDPLKGQKKPRPIRPRDILILVRNRTTLMEAIVSALKQRGIPVAGVDRLKVTEHIAVQDMLALCRFLLLPADDLSLAAVLKSPLLARDDGKAFDDDDLLRLRGELFDFSAPLHTIQRIHDEHSLWQQLQAAEQAGAPVREAVAHLRKWRRMTGFMPPFELLAHVLWRDGGLKRIMARLGEEALEPLEALLDLALRFEREEAPSLSTFIHWLQTEAPQIKRELAGADDLPDDDPGMVRVMTVHGAKGLEAPVVFLADTTSVPQVRNMRLVEARPESLHGEALPLWRMRKAQRPPALQELLEQERAQAMQEYNRLLYVAMTRAADRLYVCGAADRRGSQADDDGRQGGKSTDTPRNWHEWVAAVMMHDEHAVRDACGRTVWRFPKHPPQYRATTATGHQQHHVPEWANRPAAAEPGPAQWITPSRLPAPGADEPLRPATTTPQQPVLSPLSLASHRAQPQRDPFRRGVLIHKLLQYMPDLPPQQRTEHALDWLTQPAQGLSAQQAKELLQEVESVLRAPCMAALFGPSSQAEAPFAARLPGPDGQSLLISGQIDRLAVLDDEVIVADFKTARPVPESLDDVPHPYVRQLALYRHAAREIWPEKRVRAVLIYTAGPKWLELPDKLLDACV